MVYPVTITAQGQLSIPIKLRRKLDLDRAQVTISEEDGKLIIETAPDFLSLGGSLRTNKKPLSNKELDEVIAEAVAEEHALKLKRSK